MKLVNLIGITVRRDAQTITPTSVTEHELPLMRSVHGKDQITETGVAGQREVDEDGEYGRLVAKYGQAQVERVYGDEESGKLADAIKEVQPAPVAAPATDPVPAGKTAGKAPKAANLPPIDPNAPPATDPAKPPLDPNAPAQ